MPGDKIEITYVVNPNSYSLRWGAGEGYHARDFKKPKQVLAFLTEHPGHVLAVDDTPNISKGKGRVDRNRRKLKETVPEDYFKI
ncbi:MAG: hypothetical protein JW716_04255 [Candidatus Aenigmarchaeota archaeon]|nr:hypothetical protein [Candidatus Aenigmarchaeota archaeon]